MERPTPIMGERRILPMKKSISKKTKEVIEKELGEMNHILGTHMP
jgi:hypothetical protein